MTQEQVESLREKFWSNVLFIFDMTDEDCWEWKGSKTEDGYGRLCFEGKYLYATHISWYIKYGAWPINNMLHRCDCPSCINPNHLFDGTLVDNNKDMRDKNRHAHGERNNSILTESQVVNIKKRYKEGASIKDLSICNRVHYYTVYDIVKGRTWKHLL